MELISSISFFGWLILIGLVIGLAQVPGYIRRLLERFRTPDRDSLHARLKRSPDPKQTPPPHLDPGAAPARPPDNTTD